MEIVIEPRTISVAGFKAQLASQLPDVRLVVRGSESNRGVDPTTLVAIVGSSGVVVGSLITGILNILGQVHSKTMVIVGKNGRRIEIPYGASAMEVDRAIELSKELDIERLIVTR